MIPGERRLQIGSWPSIEEAVKHGMELKVWYSGESKQFTALLRTKDALSNWAAGNRLEWALDHLENDLNDEP